MLLLLFFFFFNDTATTEIYTLSLHDALPICGAPPRAAGPHARSAGTAPAGRPPSCITTSDVGVDRKSTRLNSSHLVISYAVFCLKKKKKGDLSTKQCTASYDTHAPGQSFTQT